MKRRLDHTSHSVGNVSDQPGSSAAAQELDSQTVEGGFRDSEIDVGAQRTWAEAEHERLLELLRQQNQQLLVQQEELQAQNEELRLANESLLRAQDELRKLSHAVQQSPTTIVITDTNGCIEYVNPKYTQTTGYTFEEAIGQNPRLLKSGEMPPEGYRQLWETISAGDEWRGEFHNKRKNGELYWELASISPIRDAGGVITHYVAVKEDITQRKRVEREREQLLAQVEHDRQRMEEMIYLIAHDVRQPLTIARGHVQFLRRYLDHNDLSRARASIETIEISTQRLEMMIRDLVDSARLETGQLQLEQQPLDLEQFLRESLVRLSVAVDVSRVRIRAAEPVTVWADPNRLERILGNLLSNAVKYGEPGTEIAIAVREQVGEAVVSVSDRGPGIAPEDQPHLFERGYRSTKAQKAEGLGLGLYISRLLLEAHGGQIGVESEPGKGSTFYLRLPLR